MSAPESDAYGEVDQAPDYDGIVREHLDREAERRRPFCNTWPFPSSDLDLVLPEANNAVHLARGCCDGFDQPHGNREVRDA
jgi:hypothetical protein